MGKRHSASWRAAQLLLVPSGRLVSVGGDDRIQAKAHAAVFAAVSRRRLSGHTAWSFGTRFAGVCGIGVGSILIPMSEV